MLVPVDLCACKPLLGQRENVFSVGMTLKVIVGVVVFVDALAAATSVVVALILVVVLVLPVLLVAAMLAVYTFRRVGEAAALFVGASASLRNRH